MKWELSLRATCHSVWHHSNVMSLFKWKLKKSCYLNCIKHINIHIYLIDVVYTVLFNYINSLTFLLLSRQKYSMQNGTQIIKTTPARLMIHTQSFFSLIVLVLVCIYFVASWKYIFVVVLWKYKSFCFNFSTDCQTIGQQLLNNDSIIAVF